MEETKCPVCKEELHLLERERGLAFCAACGTPHHLQCWRYAEKCSAFGCGSRTFTTVPELSEKSFSIEGTPLISQRGASLFVLLLMAATIWGGLASDIWSFLAYSAFYLGFWGAGFPLFLLAVVGFSFLAFTALLTTKYQYLIDGKNEVIGRSLTILGRSLWTNKNWMKARDLHSIIFLSEETIFGTRDAKIELQTKEGKKKELLVHSVPSTLSEGYTKTLAWQTANALHCPFTSSKEQEKPMLEGITDEELVASLSENPPVTSFSVETPGNVMRNVLSSLFFSLFYGGFCWLAMTGALGLAGPTLPWAFGMAIAFVFLAFAAAWTRRLSYSMTISLDPKSRKLTPRMHLYGIPFAARFNEKLALEDIAQVWHMRLHDNSGTLERLAVKVKSGLWRFLAASSPIDPSGDDLARSALELAQLAQVPAYLTETPALFLAFRPFYKSELINEDIEIDDAFLGSEEPHQAVKEREENSGPSCESCQLDLAAGLVATCRSCQSLNHLGCWQENGGCPICDCSFALVGPRKSSWLPDQVSCANLPWFGWSKNLLLGSSLFVGFGLYLSWVFNPLLLIPTVTLAFLAQTPLTLIDENIVDKKTRTMGKRSHFFGFLLGPLRPCLLDMKTVQEVEQREDITPAGQVVKSVTLVMKDGTRRTIGFGASAPCRANEWLAEYVAKAAGTTVRRLRSEKFKQGQRSLAGNDLPRLKESTGKKLPS